MGEDRRGNFIIAIQLTALIALLSTLFAALVDISTPKYLVGAAGMCGGLFLYTTNIKMKLLLGCCCNETAKAYLLSSADRRCIVLRP